MRIALWSPRMTGYSGVELYTFDLALALARASHAVSVHSQVGFEDHFKFPLARAGIEMSDFDRFPEGIEVNVSPKFGPYKAAAVTGRPILQVLHSEHLTDVPMKFPYPPRGVILIRHGQRFLMEIEPAEATIPFRVIRNPIDLSRFALNPDADPEFGCIMVSEFDDMKARLAEEVRAQVDRDVLLIGPWRSEIPIPAGCRHEGPILDVALHYARARTAFSYRLSRQFAEGISCGLPVIVRGGLEPPIVTGHDRDGDWTMHAPNRTSCQIAREFDADRVAAQVIEFAKECIA